MRLNPLAREYYTLAITTDPAVTSGWEASFDGGTTWVAGTVTTSGTSWLVAGAQADPTGATVIAQTTEPIIRATQAPEVIVRKAPRITT